MGELVNMLANQMVDGYDKLLKTGSTTTVSQDGAIQLLFDVNFIADVLSARGSVESEESKACAAQLEHVRSALRDIIDPFDIIVFERPLHEARARYYMRCEILLSNFIRLNRLHSGVKAGLTTSDRDNMIALAPSVSRFPLLPVSTPKGTGTTSLSSQRTNRLFPSHSESVFDQMRQSC